VKHILCIQIHREQNSIYFLSFIVAVIYSYWALCSDRFRPKEFVK